jgi:hypothetical protein
MFYEWQGYKLRLDAKRVSQLEDALGGKSPLSIFVNAGERNVPPLKDMLLVLHYALQPLNHGIKMDDTYAIYDKFIDEGKTLVDFIPVMIEVYKVSGLIPADTQEAEVKN